MEYLVNFGEPPSVDRYRSTMEPPRRPIPSLHQIKTAISTLQTDPKSVSIFMLEDIMMLVYIPKHFGILTGSIVPSCIAILEESAKHSKILDNEIAVLALQVLCLSIAAAMLVRNKWLDKFLASLAMERERGFFPDGRCDVSMHLVAWLSTSMGDIVKRGSQDLNHGLAAAHELFGFGESKKTKGLLMCFEEIGEFNKHHTRFLLHHFWTERKYVMKAFQEVFMPGWSFILHIMWKHAEFLDEDGADLFFMQLRELVIRYSLVCTSFEDVVMHHHFRELRYAVQNPPSIDREDLAKVVSCFVLKLVPPYGCPGSVKQIPLDFALDLTEALFYDVHRAEEYGLSLPLLKAGFTRLWVEVSKVPGDDTAKWIDVVPFLYMLLSITHAT
ncbi:hypothetical protein FRC06_002228 [Ceratobasidium sp. 370]|nr:hypothetical protein FRC06_002228 [Ceratobasidium sp. 370]